jgi:hypothetical protein
MEERKRIRALHRCNGTVIHPSLYNIRLEFLVSLLSSEETLIVSFRLYSATQTKKTKIQEGIGFAVDTFNFLKKKTRRG